MLSTNYDLINKLKEKTVIDEYGTIDFHKLKKMYSDEKAEYILNNIQQGDIYDTYTVDELYRIGIDMVQSIRMGFIRRQVISSDALSLLELLEVIRLKEIRIRYDEVNEELSQGGITHDW